MTTFDAPDDMAMRGPSLTTWLIGLTVVVFILWAAMAWVEEIVRAPGQIVPSSRPQIIQNLEGGILAELNVAEGDIVEDGQILARLYGTQYQATVDELDDQIAALVAPLAAVRQDPAQMALTSAPFHYRQHLLWPLLADSIDLLQFAPADTVFQPEW